MASMYMNSHETFVNTAKFWTETYARPDSSHDEVSEALINLGPGLIGARSKLAFNFRSMIGAGDQAAHGDGVLGRSRPEGVRGKQLGRDCGNQRTAECLVLRLELQGSGLLRAG